MAGTVVLTSHKPVSPSVGRSVITATADAADGSFPTATLASLGIDIEGTLLAIQTNPGSTAPTDNYDITLIDVDGLDRLNGVGLNRDTSTSERAVITGTPYVATGETLTLTIAGNSVNSAVVVITLYHSAQALSFADAAALASLIALLPSALGQTTKAASLSVAIASDQTVPVVGNVAHDAADSGNPVKVGGKATSSTPAAVAQGDRVDQWFSLTGAAAAMGHAQSGADGTANVLGALHAADGTWYPMSAAGMVFNGTTWDRLRNNVEATLLASAARTATTNSPDQTNHNARGVHVSIDVTVEGPATLAIKIQGKHSVGGTYYDIVDFGTVYTAATDTPGVKTVVLYPGILTADAVGVGAGVNGTIQKSAVLPRTWRAVVTHADATTCTYSLSAVTIL